MRGFVVQPGLEPGKTAPKTVVLPLHHWTIYLYIKHRISFCSEDRVRTCDLEVMTLPLCQLSYLAILYRERESNPSIDGYEPSTVTRTSRYLAVDVGFEPQRPIIRGILPIKLYYFLIIFYLELLHNQHYTYLPVSFCGTNGIRTRTTHRDRVVL